MATQISPPLLGSPVASLSPRLSRRDWILLPLLSLATIGLIFGVAEIGSRILFPYKDYDECRVPGSTNPRQAKPNCTVRAKEAEGPWLTYAMNSCGYRTYAPCGPKQQGVLRLALLGASMTMAKNVPLEDSWGERVGRAISRNTGRKVEVENMGWELLSPLHCYRQLSQIEALKPDLVVYAVNPFDLSRGIDPKQLAHRDDLHLPAFDPPKAEQQGFRKEDVLKFIQNAMNNSRAMLIAQHLLFSNPHTFLKIYLADGHRADYVRYPFSPSWQEQFADFDLLVSEMATRLRAQGIPLVIVGLPARAQVILIRDGNWPSHVDPYAYDRELEKTCKRAGIPYIPTLDAFSRTPDGDKLFYIFDQHITPQGDAVIARELLRKCFDGFIPAFMADRKEAGRKS